MQDTTRRGSRTRVAWLSVPRQTQALHERRAEVAGASRTRRPAGPHTGDCDRPPGLGRDPSDLRMICLPTQTPSTSRTSGSVQRPWTG
jgi:hypothetical protein